MVLYAHEQRSEDNLQESVLLFHCGSEGVSSAKEVWCQTISPTDRLTGPDILFLARDHECYD